MEFVFAEREDTEEILAFIRELADYEKMLDQVVADVPTLEHWLFDLKKAEVIFAVEDGVKVDSRCSSTISRHFWDAPGSIWKICT